MFLIIYLAVLVVFIFAYFFIASNLLRMKKIKIFNYYANDFEKFDLSKLQTKFKLSYKKYKNEKYEVFQSLSDDVENLEKSIHKILQRDYEDILKYLKKWYLGLFSYASFKKGIKNLEEKQEEYKIKFLNILFELNEINLDYEIKDNLLVLIKDFYGEVKSIINTSKFYNEIISSKLNDEIHLIEADIEFLEKIVLSKQNIETFEKGAKKTLQKVEELYYGSMFFVRTMNFLRTIIPKYDERYVDVKDNIDKIYQSYAKTWKKDFETIKKDVFYVRENITNDINLRSLQKIYKKIDYITDKITLILTEAKNAKDYVGFMDENSKNLDLILKGVRNKYEKSMSDLDKYFLKEKEIKTKDLNKLINRAELLYKDFLLKRSDNYKNFSPIQIYATFIETIKVIKEFLSELNKIILDIRLVIEQTNNVNEILYQMNNILLQVEIRMNHLPDKIKFVKEQEFQRFQNKVSEFIEKYKDNFLLLTNEENNMIKYENKNVKSFYKEIISTTYLYNYIEDLIVTLNKYRNDNKIDKLIDLVERNYVHGNLSESLRIANKIVELYKIYE